MRWLALSLPIFVLLGCAPAPDMNVDPCVNLEEELLPKTMESFEIVKRDGSGLIADFVMKDGRTGRVTCDRANRKTNFEIG